MRAVAFGLQLESSFALPGIRESAVAGLPELHVELAPPERLDGLWDERGARREWQGLLGDGHALEIERDALGARVFRYGDRALFHLDAPMQRLTCVPGSAGLDWQRTLLSKVVPAVSVMRGYEALHAAAVQGPHGAVAIAAPSGAGKSTLALELIGRGWPLLADDVLALSPLPGGALAHPGVAQMNVGRVQEPAAPLQTIGVLGNERWVSVERAARGACPVAAVVLLERAQGRALTCEVAARTPLPLAPYMLGLADTVQRRLERFELFAELSASRPVLRLSAGSEVPPGALADELQAALSAPGVSR